MFNLLLQGLLGLSYSTVTAVLAQYSYLAIFILLVLEAASLPIPSEVVLPAVGYFAATGQINLFLGFLVVILGGFVGMGIDYYVAYFFGKEVVYKHASKFHISKKKIQAFDAWFARNGAFAVFITRLMPVVRGLINFPAGFAGMPVRTFFSYSIIGTAMWDVLLIGFGYYALSITNAYIVAEALVIFTAVLYAVYYFGMRSIRRKR